MARLEIQQLSKRFGSVRAIDSLDLDVPDGELLAVLGPSGSGKTTLLRLIAGLERPLAGRICVDGADVTRLPPRDRDLAMVFQQDALYPHLTVAENLKFGLQMRRVSGREAAERLRTATEVAEVGVFTDRLPAQLSGGQKQRVALARALVRRPKLLLLDEPLSQLDGPARAELRRSLARAHRALKLTMIYVTHDQVEAMALGQRVMVLRDGGCHQLGPPLEVYDRPQSMFVGEFLGAPPMNFLPARLEAGQMHVGGATLTLGEPGLEDASDAWLGLRPESMRINGEARGPLNFTAAVAGVKCLGFDTVVELRWQDLAVQARLAGRTTLQPGDQVQVSVAAEDLHWFDRQSGQRLDL